MKEEEMFPIIFNFLTNNGYQVVESHPGKQRGPDIVAIKSNRKMTIEVKGDSACPDVDLGTGIWQLLRYIKDDKEDFALAVSPKYLSYVKMVQVPLKKLGVKVFVASEKGVIELPFI